MKPVGILVEQAYQVLEVWYPYLRLREENIPVVFIGPEKKEYPSKEGYPVKAEVAAREMKAADLSALIVPGGWAPDFLRRYAEVNRLVREVFESGKCVAGICHGGWVLASAGILKGKNATCFFAIKDDLVHAGASYSDAEVVIDGNLITSRTPLDLSRFTQEIIRYIKKN